MHPCAQVFLVCAVGHSVARLTEGFGKQRRKGAGVAVSQALSHCTTFLQLGLTHSVQGMCLFRASQEKEVAPGRGGRGAWYQRGMRRESRGREKVFAGGHNSALCHVHLLFLVSDK